MNAFDSWMQQAETERKAAQDTQKLWNESAVDCILQKINQRHQRAPFDKAVLAADLENATKIYNIWKNLDRQPSEKQLCDRTKRILRLCERLQTELPDPDDFIADVFSHLMFPTAVEVDILNATIANLVAIRKLANQTFSAGASATSEGLKTAADWLIGKKLAEIYERHFTSKPRGVSYRSGRKQPGGPSIDFTLGVLQIMGVTNYHGHPYQAAGIVEIWKRT